MIFYSISSIWRGPSTDNPLAWFKNQLERYSRLSRNNLNQEGVSTNDCWIITDCGGNTLVIIIDKKEVNSTVLQSFFTATSLNYVVVLLTWGKGRRKDCQLKTLFSWCQRTVPFCPPVPNTDKLIIVNSRFTYKKYEYFPVIERAK